MMQRVNTRRMPAPVVLVPGAIEQRRLFRQNTPDLSVPMTPAERRRERAKNVGLAVAIAVAAVAFLAHSLGAL